MANNAANLVGAQLLFGTMANNVFTADLKAQIQGNQNGSIRVETNSITITGTTTINSTLTVGGTITGNIAGNATSATRLQSARTIGASGDASGSVSFNGTANVNIPIMIEKIRGVNVSTSEVNPTGTNRLNIEGYLYATRVYNAVWNDIVDFINIPKSTLIEYGRAYIRSESGSVQLPSRYAEQGVIGIASDTYGFGVGRDDENHQLPLAIGGFVLAQVDRGYRPGTPLTCTKSGVLTKAKVLIRILFPERIVAIFDRKELATTWNGVTVNDRSWVKVF